MPVYEFAMKTALLVLLACCSAGAAEAQEETPFTRLFDTGTPATTPLTSQALQGRTGWQLIPEDKTDHHFHGDAILLNDKLAVALRKQGRGPEIYAKTSQGFQWRATLGRSPAPTSPWEEVKTRRIIENTVSGVMVEAEFNGPTTATQRFRLTTGEGLLEIKSPDGTGFLNVQTRTRQVVVPDYFGDDMVYGPAAFQGLWLPTENICLNLIEGGEAMVMSVWQSREQEACLTSAEGGLSIHSIRCRKGQSIWLAFLESPGLWRAGNDAIKAQPPFPAKWRVSLAGTNGVAESWDWERGTPTKPETVHPPGTLLVYPLDRTSTTPLTVTCPTDVMRNTLGVGPCQYILAVEGLSAEGDPTPNNVMHWVEQQFAQKKEKKVADDLKERVEVMLKHVAEVRAKIERYAAFSSQTRTWLAGKSGTEVFSVILDDLDQDVKAGLAPATAPERARQLASKVTALIGREQAGATCQQLGAQLRALGAIQDRTLAKSRLAIRRLKQQGRTTAANQPEHAALALEVQRRAEQMLQK